MGHARALEQFEEEQGRRKANKKSLQDQFISKMKKKTAAVSAPEPAPSVFAEEESELLKAHRKELKKLKEQFERDKKTLSEEIKKVKKQADVYKSENAKLKKDKFDLSMESSRLQIRADQMKRELHYAKAELAETKADFAACKVRFDSTDDYDKRIANLALKKTALFLSNQALKKEMASWRRKALVNNTIASAEARASIPLKKVAKPLMHLSVGALLTLADSKLDDASFRQCEKEIYAFVRRAERYRQLAKLSKKMSNAKSGATPTADIGAASESVRNQAASVKSLIGAQKEAALKKVQFGFMMKKENQWIFYNLAHEISSVAEVPKHLEVDDPVKAVVTDGKAEIIHVYKSVPAASVRGTNGKRKSSVQNGDEKQHIRIGNLEVLIIGIEKKNDYVARLQKHGVSPVWHDPVEESYDMLKSKFKRADIVLFCERHNKHSARYAIDTTDPRVEFIQRDNEEVIVARTRFAALRLGLIK